EPGRRARSRGRARRSGREGWRLPSSTGGTEAVSDCTVPPLPPHTKLALTAVTGPASPVDGRIRSRTFTCRFPLASRDAKPLLTVQGEPALSTPPITIFGLFPARVECS